MLWMPLDNDMGLTFSTALTAFQGRRRGVAGVFLEFGFLCIKRSRFCGFTCFGSNLERTG